jgi:hypothetical protein
MMAFNLARIAACSGLLRLEVFTGSDRRRAWSAEQKAGIVAEIRAPWLLLSTCSRGGERAHR